MRTIRTYTFALRFVAVFLTAAFLPGALLAGAAGAAFRPKPHALVGATLFGAVSF